jgi:hypothetical protein
MGDWYRGRYRPKKYKSTAPSGCLVDLLMLPIVIILQAIFKRRK